MSLNKGDTVVSVDNWINVAKGDIGKVIEVYVTKGIKTGLLFIQWTNGKSSLVQSWSVQKYEQKRD